MKIFENHLSLFFFFFFEGGGEIDLEETIKSTIFYFLSIGERMKKEYV